LKALISFLKLVPFWAPVLFLASCISPNNEAFEAPPDLAQVKTDFIDTFSIGLETYRLDSIRTGGIEYLMAGKYEDGILGPVSCESYLQFLPPSYPIAYPDGIIESSIEASVSLRFDYTYGLVPETLDTYALHRLTENLSGDKTWYSESAGPAYEIQPLMVTDSALRDKRILTIKANALGREIMNKLKTKGSYQNDVQFLSDFKGFALKSKNTYGYVARFDLRDSSGFPPGFLQIRYKRLVDGAEKQENILFRTNNTTVQYYRIKPDYTGKAWAGIPPGGGLKAQNGEYAALQAGTSLAIKLRIPGILSWAASQKKKLKVFKAVLEIEPEAPQTGFNLLPPPATIRISSRSDYHNPQGSSINQIVFNDDRIFSLQQANQSLAQALSQPSAQLFGYNATTRKYACTITRHIQEITDGKQSSTELNLFAGDLVSTVNRMLLKPEKVKLKIFYYSF
jgi:hypothetical protein